MGNRSLAMRLRRLEIQNYKSLRDVVIEPGPLSVFVGPNAAGKSNLVDAIDFLGDVYRWSLEQAVARKGGYENICYRQAKRSKAPIRCRVVLEGARKLAKQEHNLTFDHTFEFRTKSQRIQSPFFVSSEEFAFFSEEGSLVKELLRFRRGHNMTPESTFDRQHELINNSGLLDLLVVFPEILVDMRPTELATPLLQQFTPLLTTLYAGIGSSKIFQLSPWKCREAGVSTPNPELDRLGGNLPALIAYLKENHQREYSLLLETMASVFPSIEEITTDFTHTKRLGLFVKERGFSHPWAAEDVSDGTILTIALLAAIVDPRTKLLAIEEPENSVHPWGVRAIVQAARAAAGKKQIFFTTHSPVVVNQLKPEEIWVVQRPVAETKIDPLLKLDSTLQESWEEGKFLLSDYLDSGAVPEAVPAVHV
jgi:predicted ATPase